MMKVFKPFKAALTLVGIGMLFGVSLHVIEASPRTRNQISEDGFEITIRIPIDVIGLRGKWVRDRATGQKVGAADYWETGAETIWNEGLADFKYRGCYSLMVDLDIQALGDSDDTQSGHHWVWLERAGFRSKVSHGGGKNEDTATPYRESRWGQWGRIRPETVAHESGHFLGLGDDYTDQRDEEGNFVRSQELPGREGTMMANYWSNPEGRVDQALVDRLGDLLSEFIDLPPCINGFWEGSDTREEGADSTTASVDFLIFIKPDESGELSGRATGGFTLDGTVTEGRCSFEYGTYAEIELALHVEGKGDGPYTIEAVEDQKVNEVQRHYLCDQAIDLTLDWDVGLLIEDVIFEDGQWIYEDEEDHIVLVYAEPEPME